MVTLIHDQPNEDKAMASFMIVPRDVYVKSVREHEISTKEHYTAFRAVAESYDVDFKYFASAEYAKPVYGVGQVSITYRVKEEYIVQ